MEWTKELALKEISVYHSCGVLFVIMTIALVGTVILLLHAKGGMHYPGVAIFAVAAYTFYKVIVSIVHLARAGKLRVPLLMAIRDIGYIDACVSVLALQTAMFSSFGKGAIEFERCLNGVTSLVVCLMVLIMGIRCIRISSTMRTKLLKGGNACDSNTCSGR